MKKFNKEKLEYEIKNACGSLNGLKKSLRDNAKFIEGAWFNTMHISGCDIQYSSRDTVFAKYIVTVHNHEFSKQPMKFALDLDSINVGNQVNLLAPYHLELNV